MIKPYHTNMATCLVVLV